MAKGNDDSLSRERHPVMSRPLSSVNWFDRCKPGSTTADIGTEASCAIGQNSAARAYP
jgi:hypothetical protein